MPTWRDAPKEIQGDIRELRDAAREFLDVLQCEEADREKVDRDGWPGVPSHLVRDAEALVRALCRYIGHTWVLDQCGYLDHAYCAGCREKVDEDNLGEVCRDLDWYIQQRGYVWSPPWSRYDGLLRWEA